MGKILLLLLLLILVLLLLAVLALYVLVRLSSLLTPTPPMAYGGRYDLMVANVPRWPALFLVVLILTDVLVVGRDDETDMADEHDGKADEHDDPSSTDDNDVGGSVTIVHATTRPLT
jgi:hypothetical protein